jgi:glycosyltransferase involved in cell wall biosynthesis
MWLLARQLRLARTRMVVLTASMRQNLERCGLTGSQISLIPNGVDCARFVPCPSHFESAPTVVCVAQLRFQKGLDLLLQAWPQVLAQVPQACLRIVGTGPMLTDLQALTDSLNILASVTFVGQCREVVSELQQGQVFVLPSRWEGMPNALLEAMACGMPCVATRVSGSEDLLASGSCGLLVPVGDTIGLAQALITLLTQPELARSYGVAAREHIEHQYAFQRVNHRFLDLYRAVWQEVG